MNSSRIAVEYFFFGKTRDVLPCYIVLEVLKSMIEVVRSDAKGFVPHFSSGEPVSEHLPGKI